MNGDKTVKGLFQQIAVMSGAVVLKEKEFEFMFMISNCGLEWLNPYCDVCKL